MKQYIEITTPQSLSHTANPVVDGNINDIVILLKF